MAGRFPDVRNVTGVGGATLVVAGALALLPAGCAAKPGAPSASVASVTPTDLPRELAPTNPQCIRGASAGPSSDGGAAVASAPMGATSEAVDAKEALSEGMARPSVVCPPHIYLSEEAVAHGVSGLALVQCVIDLDGWLSQCRLVKSLPYMDEQILAAAMTVRYTPVMFRGQPRRVRITVPMRVLGPPPPPAP